MLKNIKNIKKKKKKKGLNSRTRKFKKPTSLERHLEKVLSGEKFKEKSRKLFLRKE